MMITNTHINVPKPELGVVPVALTDTTMRLRLQSVLIKMRAQNLDSIVIYADLEHGSNFEYLVGFLPRFEEALLVLHVDGSASLILGNENLNKASKARLVANAIHLPHFSLPNQPMATTKTVAETMSDAGIGNDSKIGLVGWKLFTSHLEDNTAMMDIPYYLVQALQQAAPKAEFLNTTAIFIGPDGVRTRNNANEFAHYEFGATLAGNAILKSMSALDEGKTEMEIAQNLDAGGQTHSVVTIMATGERFVKANMYPTSKQISLGDPLSITTGFKGGLQSRGGFAVHNEAELPADQSGYLDAVAKPYFNAIKTWLEQVHVGMTGDELYQLIESVLPKEQYGWKLNPGHLCADEEWLASPIYPGSIEKIESGMLFQLDIIPSVPGFGGVSCESGVLVADAELRASIARNYPELDQRLKNRRNFINSELGIKLNAELVPTSIATALCRPYLLDKDSALVATE